MSHPSVSRRNFLRVSMIAGGGMLVGFSALSNSETGDNTEATPFSPNAYIKISPDGKITLMSPNPEIGQGVKTSLVMLIAEEMNVDWQTIDVEIAPLDAKYGSQTTGGSGAIRSRYAPLRQAGATAKAMLIAAAADTWNVPVTDCYAEKGFVIHKSSGKKLSYGELATKAAGMPVPTNVPLKDPKDFTIIGTRVKDVDAKAIVTGKPLFGIDTRKEGMLFAVVARPPAHGKKLQSFDDSAALKVNGVKKVVQVKNSVAVLATSTWAAMKGRTALKINWEDASKLESTADHEKAFRELLSKPAATPNRNDGDVDAAMSAATKVLDVMYEVPVLSHAQMEPLNFYADVRDGKAELYGPTQVPQSLVSAVAKELNIPATNVSLGLPRQGGGFGRKLRPDNGVEAALVSQAAQCPVQVQWSREDDMQNDFYRPSGMFRFKAAIKDGNLEAWHQSFASLSNGRSPDTYPAGAIQNLKIESHSLPTNIPTGPWRAPTHNVQAFANESFMDEVAHELKKDPVAFRLELLKKAKEQPVGKLAYDPDKFISVIELVAKMCNWGKTPANTYRGFSTWFSFNSYVAQVVEIQMLKGKPRITKVYCAVHCGKVVNVSGAENQVQGAVVDGLGHAVYTKLTFNNGAAVQTNFGPYNFVRMRNTPLDVVVQFVPSEENPTGLGEPGLPPIAPALANALFAATGKRFRKMPFVDDIQFA
ncbi:MAG: xanthine dehydrogenase family protein molybdopterin-binding subunit [Sediminibacterium sp. Gen4]|jgi:isoquinoline 1-oxidoreductase subunit beta|uniref:xanthine dehydrogenase family protein molybdopterin-binding subunit n=1 Tax=unclassified Sediminibacterium TaxID=2635961 RepID=UPI0015B7AC24|nr:MULTISPECIES: molybdopterin cofactor-binding domain-containing protein [unclassified Sediminibacterium]MBW0161868.1 molybdopterin-dependent oxidoreductase [Sediminibacterium sp.]MBW0164667.1 molybdopterin-dependent oxidoreductase [Sediminibacterium sp.]NWK66014.1 xanthine dehydrogenase family protein molybdopterin-binding subunit [Sediminibacterium sp. Gen4]